MKVARTVRQLRELIKDLPGDMVILTSGSDHSYNKADVYLVDAAFRAESRWWSEYFGDESLDSGEEKMQGLLVI